MHHEDIQLEESEGRGVRTHRIDTPSFSRTSRSRSPAFKHVSSAAEHSHIAAVPFRTTFHQARIDPEVCNRSAASTHGWAPESLVLAKGEPDKQHPDEDDEDAVLLARCRQEGPPGPAGGVLALPGPGIEKSDAATRVARGPPLSECIAWLCALRALDLPFDGFHLGSPGAGAPRDDVSSFLKAHNLAAVAQHPFHPRRWHLVVLVRRIELVAGEIDILVCDPTGEMEATVDRRAVHAWPRAVSEGATLILADVVALPPAAPALPAARRTPRLLIMERSLARAFAPGDAEPEEALRLLREARVAVSCARG